MAEPDTPPKNSDDSTLICPSPPRRRPTSDDGERDQAIGDAAAHHHLAREDEQRNRDQRRHARAGCRLLHDHECRQTQIHHRGQRGRRQRERDRHADQQQQREDTEQNGDGHGSVPYGRCWRRGEQPLQREQRDQRAAQRRSAGTPGLAATARRPSACSSHPAISTPPQNASTAPMAITTSRAMASSTRRTRGGATCSGDEETEVRFGAHAGGGAEHHRRAHQQQRDRLGPARRVIQHVAREHLPRLDERHADERKRTPRP